jgi:Flp pilus assembly protein TadB
MNNKEITEIMATAFEEALERQEQKANLRQLHRTLRREMEEALSEAKRAEAGANALLTLIGIPVVFVVLLIVVGLIVSLWPVWLTVGCGYVGWRIYRHYKKRVTPPPLPTAAPRLLPAPTE